MAVSAKLFTLGLILAGTTGGSPPPPGNPPVNTVLPAITGTTTVGQQLSGSDGTWTGDATITFTYRWLRNGVAIGGATANTYTQLQADAGAVITFEVTATNGVAPDGVATSDPTAEVMDARAAAYFARRGTQPTTARKTVYNTLFRALRSGAVSGSDIIPKLDYLKLEATDNQADALLNLVSSSFPSTLVNAPTFTADLGFDTNGTNSYVDMGLTPSTGGGQYTQNSMSIGFFSRKSGQHASTAYGWNDGTRRSTISPRTSADMFAGAPQNPSGSVTQIASTDGYGFFAINRSGATALQLYKNGASVGSAATGSAVLVTASLKVGSGAAATFVVAQVSATYAGASLTANEHLDLYNAIRAYLTSVGVP